MYLIKPTKIKSDKNNINKRNVHLTKYLVGQIFKLNTLIMKKVQKMYR